MIRKRLGQKSELPAPCKPVSGKHKNTTKGPLVRNGIFFENYEWMPHLTKSVSERGVRRTIGKEPKLIPAGILIASGHTSRSATTCIKAYLLDLDKDFIPERDAGLARVRELCLDCAATVPEVRKCALINCPLWAHRLGYNPHTWHKRHSRTK